MPRRLLRRGLILACVCSASISGANPIVTGADPHALLIGREYWMYPTNAGGADRLMAHSSTDLRCWRQRGELLRLDQIKWIRDDGVKKHFLWAPALAEGNGRYYFYYSVGPQDPTPSRIGVAVGSKPEGPFTDIGRPLVTGGKGFEAIDPMVYHDVKGGQTYLYAGGSNGARLRVWLLKPDMVTLDREVPVGQPQKFTEGAFMHERNGIYYLSYSFGNWDRANYSVHYSTASSPTGPWAYRGVILRSDAKHQGPGHHSFIRNPKTDRWTIVYHRWEIPYAPGMFRGERQIAFEPIDYAADGSIEKVRMTNAVYKDCPRPRQAPPR